MKPPLKRRRPPNPDFPKQPPKEEKREDVVFDLNELLARYGVSRNFSSAIAVGDAVQKLSAEIIVIQQVLLLEKLKLHASGEYPYPNYDFVGMKIASEIFMKAWGYEKLVNTQAAIATLEGQGFKVDAINYLEAAEQPEVE
jgi:hypothetical protein